MKRGLEKYQMVMSYIIKTMMRWITTLKTLSLSQEENTSLNTQSILGKTPTKKKKRMVPKETDKKYMWHRSVSGRKILSERSKNQYRGFIVCPICEERKEVKSKEHYSAQKSAGLLMDRENGELNTQTIKLNTIKYEKTLMYMI